MRKSVLTAIVLFVAVLAGHAQQPVASLSSDKIRIGEQVYLTLRLPAAGLSGKQLVWPRLADTINSHIEILDSVIDAKTFTKKYLITSFDSGTYQLPAFGFKIGDDSLLSNTVTLQVGTVAVDTTQAIRDIKTIQGVAAQAETTPWYKNIWLLAGLAVLLLALAVFLWLRYRKKTPAPAPVAPLVVVPLHEQLLADLHALDQQQLWQNGQVKQYYVALTDLLRAYIEKRYNVKALEQTTVQLVNNLRTSAIYPEALQLLRNILELADMVKFAKARPDAYGNQALMDNARQFALLTKVVEEPKIG